MVTVRALLSGSLGIISLPEPSARRKTKIPTLYVRGNLQPEIIYAQCNCNLTIKYIVFKHIIVTKKFERLLFGRKYFLLSA